MFDMLAETYKFFIKLEFVILICYLSYLGIFIVFSPTNKKDILVTKRLSAVDVYTNLQTVRFLKSYEDFDEEDINLEHFDVLSVDDMDSLSIDEGDDATNSHFTNMFEQLDMPPFIDIETEEEEDYSDMPPLIDIEPEEEEDYSDMPPLIDIESEEKNDEPLEEQMIINEKKITVSKWNVNINPIFYNREKFHAHIKVPDNELEKKWASRKIIENTPRGNIIMYYNVFNEGFTYYCDQSGISYAILNAVAMKYVLTFRCRDFFIDETVIPDGFLSPFIDFERELEKIENDKKKSIMNNLSNISLDIDSSPFAKLKTRIPRPNHDTIGSSSINTKSKLSKVMETIISKNRFLYKGRIQNCQIIQEQKTEFNKKENFNLNQKFLSYKDYKESKASKQMTQMSYAESILPISLE
jgi:hypothetical protein